MIEMKIINMNYIYTMWMSQKKKEPLFSKHRWKKDFFK